MLWDLLQGEKWLHPLGFLFTFCQLPCLAQTPAVTMGDMLYVRVPAGLNF